MLEIADNTGLMLVATNDCHFDKTEMFVSQRVLSCIAASERLASMSKRAVTAHHFFKSADEMTELFADIPEAVQKFGDYCQTMQLYGDGQRAKFCLLRLMMMKQMCCAGLAKALRCG